MKIHILFRFKNVPTGGGNQFLLSLREYLQLANAYQPDVEKADVILFNSYQYIHDVAKVKLKYPHKLFVHRIDGPIRLYNTMTDKRDNVTNIANCLIAEATIFQSEWSRKENYRLGLKKNYFETVIVNAPNPGIFNHDGKASFSTNRKIRLIMTSWSSNWKKGFHVYQWLDDNLDFTKYEMIFVGNSPLVFKNVKHIPPLSSEQLAGQLKKSDIFIAASEKDPCSNSLIEALHCGLPAVGLQDGGHPELIGRGGEIFTKTDQIPSLLEKIIKNYAEYQTNIRVPNMQTIGRQYYDFMHDIYQNVQNDKVKAKNFGITSYLITQSTIYRWRLSEYIAGVISRCFRNK